MLTTARVRAATENDVESASDIFLITAAEMMERLGLPIQPFDRTRVIQGYTHVLHTGTFYVAELDGKVTGVCNGITRDEVFFLSGFWILPELQGRRIGGKLMQAVWRDARKHGATGFCVWASLDARATALYLKFKMFPGTPLLRFIVPHNEYDVHIPNYSVQKLDAKAAGEIDWPVRATRRAIDHKFLLAEPEINAQVVRHQGKAVGYFYQSRKLIGPVAWLHPEHADVVLSLALASSDGNERSIMVPGCNHAAIKKLLSIKGKFYSLANFLTTHDTWKLDQYIPSGPLLF